MNSAHTNRIQYERREVSYVSTLSVHANSLNDIDIIHYIHIRHIYPLVIRKNLRTQYYTLLESLSLLETRQKSVRSVACTATITWSTSTE